MDFTEDYFVGDDVGASVTFRRPNNELTDPTDVTARVVKPDGTIVDYGSADVFHVSVGLYTVIVHVDQPGRWYFLFEGTGALVAAPEGFFDVRQGRVPR